MQGICIQGPLTYYKEIVECWNGWPNVVISTWVNEDQDKIDYIRSSSNIDVVLSIPPNIAGDMNINYQCASTFIGLNFLHRKGCTEVLKIRSDHTVNDVKSLLEILQGRKLSFLAISDESKRRDLIYELEYTHYGHDYPADNLIYGDIEKMLLMFNFQTDRNYNIPPESLIVWNYMTNAKIPFGLSYEYFLKHGISFFIGECAAKGIKINWLKKNIEMVQFYNNEYFKF